jgi:acyl-coenzyme A synthetase/AMP-(fatty) acid ligase
VVPKAGSNPSEDALKAALRSTLSSYKVPRNIVFVADADIPRTSTGKVRLFALADMISARILAEDDNRSVI